MCKPRYRYSIITSDTAIIRDRHYASIYEVTLREVEVTETTTTTSTTTTSITENLGQITIKAKT